MKRDWSSRAGLLMIGGILIVVNLIGLNLFARIDLTDDQVYSLSDASLQLVEGLEDPVTITAYFSEGLPAPYSANRRYLRDKLDDYRAYGGDEVQYQFVDPGTDEQLRREAGAAGIPSVQIQVLEQDNMELRNAYMGVAIEYGGQRESIPVVDDIATLEYDITGAIRRLTRDELPTVGLLAGHGETGLQDMQVFGRELRRNYGVQTITINEGRLSGEPDVLLVVAPTDSVSQAGLEVLDQYVMNGGRIAFLLNQVLADLQSSQARAHTVGLEPLLAEYGMRIRPNLIMDEQSSFVTTQRQQGMFNVSQQVKYPFLVVATNFNQENLMVSRLNRVMFYFVSSIDTSYARPDGVQAQALVSSTGNAGTQEGYFNIMPTLQQENAATLAGGPFTLAAAYTGSFPSITDPSATSVPTRLVLIGDGDFINQSLVGENPGNIEFALNVVDWLAQDDAMLAIRSKNIEPRQLPDVSEGRRPWIKYGNMFAPVAIVLLVGLWRWRRRTNREPALD